MNTEEKQLKLLEENNRLLRENNTYLKYIYSMLYQYLHHDNSIDFTNNILANLIASKIEKK